MSETLALLDVVALLADVPEHALVRGQVGTIVEHLAGDMFEVEFSNDQGRTYALVPLSTQCVMRLHHQPVQAD
jgi:hypothetical protein